MIDLFNLAPQDQSVYYLSQIFGGMGAVLPSPDGPGVTISLLGTLFRLFNSVILAIGALVIVYTTVVGVMTTAAEGEFLGKKFHGLWTPIRSVIGIAALVPTPSGYSAIQLVMMWVILQGVSAADVVWNQTINFVSVTGSPYTKATVPSVGAANTMQGLFQSLVCQATARMDPQSMLDNSGKTSTPLYYCSRNHTDSFCQKDMGTLLSLDSQPTSYPGQTQVEITKPDGSKEKITKSIRKYTMGPFSGQDGNCGTLTYCSTDNLPQDSPLYVACQAQQQALGPIIATLGQIAQDFATKDFEYWSYYNTIASLPPAAWRSSDFKLPAPPAWLSDYCAATGKCDGKNLPLPYLPPVSGGDQDYRNPPDDTVKTVYWPYGIQKSIPLLITNPDFIKITTDSYVTSITNAINARISQEQQAPLPQSLADARKYGWIFAGAYYYVIAQMNDSNLDAANPTFEMTRLGPLPSTTEANSMKDYRNNYMAARALTGLAQAGGDNGAPPGGGAFAASPQLGELGAIMGSSVSGLMSSFLATVSGSGPGEKAVNPLAAVQSLGRGILISIEVFFVVFMALALLLLGLGYINFAFLGTFVMNPVGPVMSSSFIFIVPIIIGFMASFFTFGGLLAVYTPLIPYVIFTMGVIGWFIATIETMIAAPLVALGILSPGGQHEIMGKAEPALMLLFGVFLRPMLMIFGMMAAMLLSAVVVTMINAGFKSVMTSISRIPSLLELILFMAAYVFLIITALNKCFSLIHVIPERALAVFGHRGESYGEEQALGETKRGVEGTASGAGGMATAPAGTAQKTGKAASAYNKQEEKKNDVKVEKKE